MTPEQILTRVLRPNLGIHTNLVVTERAFHPASIAFENLSPDFEHVELAPKPIFVTQPLLDNEGRVYTYRIERKDGLLALVRVNRSEQEGITYIAGHALECEAGSPHEAVFLSEALALVMREAAGPLRKTLQDAFRAGLSLSTGQVNAVLFDIKDATNGD